MIEDVPVLAAVKGASLREAVTCPALDRGCAPEELPSSPARRRLPSPMMHRSPTPPENLSSRKPTTLVAALMRTAFQ
jgi:hypothetical protein